jgi:hypothetical protein
MGTRELIRDLETMFLAGKNTDGEKATSSKISATEAVARLANMKEPDGRRKYRKDNPETGPLPNELYVKAKFAQMKKNGLKGVVGEYKRMEKECNFSSMNVYEKRECFETYFGIKYTDLLLAQKLLEFEDTIRGIERDETFEYSELDLQSCQEILNHQGVQFKNERDINTALNIVLRFQERLSSHTFSESMSVSEHSELQHLDLDCAVPPTENGAFDNSSTRVSVSGAEHDAELQHLDLDCALLPTENGASDNSSTRASVNGVSMKCGHCDALGSACYAPQNESERHSCIHCNQFVHSVFCSDANENDEHICHFCSGKYHSRLKNMKRKNELINEAQRREIQLNENVTVVKLKELLQVSQSH